MRVLALETSSDACSAAAWHEGELVQRFQVAPRRHAELVLPMVEAVLAEAGWRRGDVELVAFGRGPGAFTGLRVAAGVAQGIAYARDLPVAPVSSLAALAQGALRERGWTQVLAAFDARMGEVYWGAYEADPQGCMSAAGDEAVCAPSAVPVPPAGPWRGVGLGWQAHGDALAAALGGAPLEVEADRYPQAADVAVLAVALARAGRTVAAADALPVYLRNRVATPRA